MWKVIFWGLSIAALASVQTVLQKQAIASTVGHKEVGCGFIHATDSSKSLRDRCQMAYGTFCVTCSGFVQLTWSDGVKTSVIFGARGITVDGTPAQESDLPCRCGLKVLDIHGNKLFWNDPEARSCDQ